MIGIEIEIAINGMKGYKKEEILMTLSFLVSVNRIQEVVSNLEKETVTV